MQTEVTIKVTSLFKEKIITQAKKMIKEGVSEQVFSDEKKQFDGMKIFIDKKPKSTLFTFDFPEEFEEGKEKKIYVGNN